MMRVLPRAVVGATMLLAALCLSVIISRPAQLTPASRPLLGPYSSPAQLLRGEKIDLNRADAHALESLPGIGPTLAQAIVAKRDALGSFHELADLRRVHGIGAKRWEKLKPFLMIKGMPYDSY